MQSYKNFALWTTRIGLFIIPFIPLYVSRSLFFPFITGKAFIFRIIVEIAVILWITLALFYKEFRPRKSTLLLALSIFLVIVALATIFGANPYRSFWSNFERMEGLITHLHLLAYFLVLGHVFRKKDWFIFFNLFVVAGLGQNIYALLQRIGFLASPQGGFRVDGAIGNATYVAAYSIFVLAITLFLWMHARKKPAKYFYGFMTVFTLLTIYFTATRGAVLALVAGIFLWGLWFLFFVRAENRIEKQGKRILIATLILLIMFGGSLKLFRESSFVQGSEVLARFASISLEEGKSRFLIWSMGIEGFRERPLLGWGPENYNLIFAKYFEPGLYSQEPWFDRSHNIIFDWAINAGIIGLLAYLSIFGAAFYMLWKWYGAIKQKEPDRARSARYVTVLLSTLFVVYILQNLFVFDQLATYMSFFAILAYIHGGLWYRREEDTTETALPFSGMKGAAVAVLVIVLIGSLYTVNYKPLRANLELLSTFQIQSADDVSGAFESYKKALAYNTLGNREVREQLSQFAVQVADAPVPDEFKQEVFSTAIEEAQASIEENPDDPRVYLFLGALYNKAGLFDGAAEVFEQAIALTPEKHQIYFELADVYITQGNYPVAVEILEFAFDLEPNYTEARFNLAVAYILNGEQTKADDLLLDGFGKVVLPELVLAQAYANIGNYGRLLGIWQAFLESEPENIQYYRNVAAVLLELGRNGEAIAVLEAAIEIDPSFKAEGETYINEINQNN